MENKINAILDKIKKLTEGYYGEDEPVKRLDWLHHLVDSYKRYLPTRVVEKIKLDPSAKKIEGERRNVTVAFADLSGFTALSETMDAEDIANIINDFFTRMVRIVFKYGGSVDKFLGDALMVLFGAPIAHHDDPERAVRAAIEMQSEMAKFNAEKKFKSPLSMSIGINTGPVVALNVGSEERMEYTVIGDTVNLAARLEGVSQAGEIIISQNTYEKIADIAEVLKRPSVKVKGKRKPVINYLLKAMQEHYRLPEITKIKFIGRIEEIRIIKDSLEKAKKKIPVVLGIVGDPGTGKTRLGIEAEVLAGNNNFTTVGARCTPYEINTPYINFIGLLNNYFKLKKNSTEEEKKLLISLKLKNLGLVLDDTLPYIGVLYSLGFPQIEALPPEELKKKIFNVIKEIFLSEAKKSLLFVRIEDLQWSDPTSLELFDYLLKEMNELSILYLFEYRSDYAFPWVSLKDCQTIVLKNFTKDETMNFSQTTLEEKNIAEEIESLIYEKSQGNPLFTAEIIKLLMKKGGIRRTKEGIITTERFKKLEIAESVSSVILDQIDRMSEMERRLLQYASVIGRSFEPNLLTTILNIAPTELTENLEKLEHFEGLLTSNPETNTYEFIAPTTYEVIYSSLLKTRRKELHLKIGEELEKRSGERIGEYLEQLAYHFARSADERKGVQYLKSAADKSYHLYALKETLNFFEQTLSLLDKKDLSNEEMQDKLEALRRQGWTFRLMGKLSEALMNQKKSLRFAHKMESLKDTAGANLNIGIIYQEMGVPQKGLNYWTRARRIAKKIGEKNIHALAVNNLGNYYLRVGNLDKALQYFTEAYKLSEESGDKRGVSLVSLNLGSVMERKGDLTKALQHYKIAHQHFDVIGDKENLARCINMTGLTHLSMGNVNEAIEQFNESANLSSKIGDKMTESHALGNIGLAYAQLWQLDMAYEKFSQSLTIAQITGEPQQLLAMNNNIGDINQFKGNINQAMQYHRQAVDLAVRIQDIFNEATIRKSIGWDYLYLAEYKRAQEEFEKSQNLFLNIGDKRNGVLSSLGAYNVMNKLSFSDEVEQIVGGLENKARQINDLEILAFVLDIKADLHLFKKDDNNAKVICEEILDLSRKINNKRLYAWILGKLAKVLIRTGEFNEAKNYLEKSSTLAKELGDKILQVCNFIISAGMAIMNSDYTNGLNTLMKATELARPSGAKEYVAEALLLTAEIFKKIGKNREAENYLAEYGKIIEEITKDFTEEEKENYIKKL